MKKIFIALVLACVCVLPAVSQSKGSETQSSKPIWDHGDNVASFTYRNVRVYKVYDYKTAYVVLYEKGGVGVGSVTIPKKWYAKKASERKLEFRNLPAGLDPYMTVIYKDEEFYKVWLTLNMDHYAGSIWGVLPTYVEVPNTDADTLIMEF